MKKKYFDERVDKNGFLIIQGSRTKYSSIDKHMNEIEIKESHPERPKLTAYALSILFPGEWKKVVKK